MAHYAKYAASIGLLVFFSLSSGFASGAMHPLERQLRDQFPSLSLVSHRTAGPLRVAYPASYDEPFIADLGDQHLVVRARGARFAASSSSRGKTFYTGAHESVDVMEIPAAGRSEELLVLQNDRAPRVFEYDIVEMRGVARVALVEGAIRFVAERPGPCLQIDRPWVVDADGRRSDTAARWTIVWEDGRPKVLRLTIDSASLTYPLVVDPSFSATGTMADARFGHSATLLPDGKVLVAGGYNGGYLNTAALYDPNTGTFTPTGPLIEERAFFTATRLLNGKVWIAGGENGDPHAPTFLASTEIFDPVTKTFSAGPAMPEAREVQTATLLPNGKVLIAGGFDGNSGLGTAFLYDPSANSFSAAIAMKASRMNHTATLLPNNKVLIAGGHDGAGTFHASAELYDVASNAFSLTTGAMGTPRQAHTSTLLLTGKVLITGGSSDPAFLRSAELYDPAAGGFAPAGTLMTTPRTSHAATLLPNGKVLIAGGYDGTAVSSSAEVYDATNNRFDASPAPLTSARSKFTATLLADGRVLVAGGQGATAVLNTSEVYQYPISTNTATMSMSTSRNYPTATLLQNGLVLVAGGNTPFNQPLQTAELFNPATGSWSPTGSMTTARALHRATLLPNGKVLVTGGNNTTVGSAELYDPTFGTFAAIADMTTTRTAHTATLLPDGSVLLAGGFVGTVHLNSAEVFDPTTLTFRAVGNLSIPRIYHTATLLPNGKVLVAGGHDGSAAQSSAELYDPATSSFSGTASMNSVRYLHTATLLVTGKVLVAGGSSSAAILDSAELYDGTTFVPTGSMTAVHAEHTATALPNGMVLIAGGDGPVGGGAIGPTSSTDIYDPSSATFIGGPTLVTDRNQFTATLLPNGNVLSAGGKSLTPSGGASAELWNAGLGFTDGQRPTIGTTTNPLCQPGSLSLSGSGFIAYSQSSSGTTQDSPVNVGLLRLQRVDNEQWQYASVQTLSAASLFSTTLSNLASGRYRVSVVSAAVPALESIVEVATTPILAVYSTSSVNVSASTVITPSLPSGYNGAFYPMRATISSGFTGTVGITPTTGAITVTNAGPIGDYTIQVASSNSCGSATTSFQLRVLGPPASLQATGGTPQTTLFGQPFATPLQATVRDSAGHGLSNVSVTFTAPSSGATASLSAGSALSNSSGVASVTATATGAAGSYNVTATVGTFNAVFALTNAIDVPANFDARGVSTSLVQLTWTAVPGATYEVLRVEPGGTTTTYGPISGGSFSDSSVTATTSYLYKVHGISPNVTDYAVDLAITMLFDDDPIVAQSTVIRAGHIIQLRTAVNAVRALAGLQPVNFSDPNLAPGFFPRTVHVTEIRDALNPARSQLLLPPLAYTDSTLTTGMVVRAAHIQELRLGIR